MKKLTVLITFYFYYIALNSQSKVYIFEGNQYDNYVVSIFQLKKDTLFKSYLYKYRQEDLKKINSKNPKIVRINNILYGLFSYNIKVKLFKSGDSILYKPLEYSMDDTKYLMSSMNDTCLRTQFIVNNYTGREVPYSDFDWDDSYCTRGALGWLSYTYLRDTTIIRAKKSYNCYVFSSQYSNMFDCKNMGDCADMSETQYIDKKTFLPIERQWIYYIGHTKTVKKTTKFKLIEVIDEDFNTDLETLFKKCRMCKDIKPYIFSNNMF